MIGWSSIMNRQSLTVPGSQPCRQSTSIRAPVTSVLSPGTPMVDWSSTSAALEGPADPLVDGPLTASAVWVTLGGVTGCRCPGGSASSEEFRSIRHGRHE